MNLEEKIRLAVVMDAFLDALGGVQPTDVYDCAKEALTGLMTEAPYRGVDEVRRRGFRVVFGRLMDGKAIVESVTRLERRVLDLDPIVMGGPAS